MAQLLIAYFSKSGATRLAAERIARVSGGDLFEIAPVKPYPAGYAASVFVAKKEQIFHELPEISGGVDNFGAYGAVALGFPVWWHTCPRVVATFLSRYDFSGKTVLPFCTHGGGGPARSARDIRALCAGDVRDCLDANGLTDDAARRWLDAV